MTPNKPLTEAELDELRKTQKNAEEQLDLLTDYERAGIDVTMQRAKLNEVIANCKKILAVWG